MREEGPAPSLTLRVPPARPVGYPFREEHHDPQPAQGRGVNVRPSSDTDAMSSKAAVAIAEERNPLDDVEAWRFHCLLRAGWEIPHAQAIAILTDVDLHVACEMVQQGCSSELAFSILS